MADAYSDTPAPQRHNPRVTTTETRLKRLDEPRSGIERRLFAPHCAAQRYPAMKIMARRHPP